MSLKVAYIWKTNNIHTFNIHIRIPGRKNHLLNLEFFKTVSNILQGIGRASD